MKRRIMAIIMGLMVAAGITIFAASPASAAYDPGACPAGQRLCTYSGYLGGTGSEYNYSRVGGCINVGGFRVNSMWNRSSVRVHWFDATDCPGYAAVAVLSPGQKDVTGVFEYFTSFYFENS